MSLTFGNARALWLSAAACLFATSSLAAEGDKKPATEESAVDLNDPAFNQYVNLTLLGKAWRELDAALLTDVALQLAEGERVLQRSHKAISSETVFDLALKTAAENRDAKALDRLGGIFEKGKNAAALDKLSTAKKLAGASRKADPALTVSALETKPDQLAVYQDSINGIRGAGLLGDQTYLASMEEGLQAKTGALTTLSDQQKDHLKKLMGQTREAMPKKADSSQTADTLSKLKAVSRDHHHHGGGHSGGGWSGGGFSGGGYGGYNSGYHLDYHQGGFQRHNGHYDYVPGHYDVHRNSGWYP